MAFTLDTHRTRVTCLCNRSIEKAERLDKVLGLDANVYQDAKEMLRYEKPDAVLICTPQDVHCEQFVLCVQAGIAAFVERPMAMDPIECQYMLVAQEKYGIKACVCHTQRYRSMIMELKHINDSGEPGEIVSVTDSIDMQYFSESGSAWCSDGKRVRSAILYTHDSHQIDHLMDLLDGSVKWLDASIEYTDSFLPELKVAQLDCGYHIMGEIRNTHFSVEGSAYSMPISSALIVRGTKGTAKMNLKNMRFEPEGLFISNNQSSFHQIQLSTSGQDSYWRQINNFLYYLEGKANNVPTLKHATTVVNILDAAIISAQKVREYSWNDKK